MHHAARLPLLLLLAALVGVAEPPVAGAQETEALAQGILAGLDSAEAARWEGVRQVRQTLRTGPVTMTVEHRITPENGRQRFDWRITGVEADFPIDIDQLGSDLPMGFSGEPPRWSEVTADEVRLEGIEVTSRGDYFQRVALVRPLLPAELAGQFAIDEPSVEASIDRLVIVLDPEARVIVRIEAEGTLTNLETGRSDVYRQVALMEDYRDIDGLQIPWRTVMRMEMPAEVMMPAGVDAAEMKRQMEEMRELAASLPPEERVMLEAMLAMSDMFGEDGVMEVSTDVVSVEVRRGD
jgi:hypothetical protein